MNSEWIDESMVDWMMMSGASIVNYNKEEARNR